VFHATGAGGRTMEGLIRDGLIAGVLDHHHDRLADELARRHPDRWAGSTHCGRSRKGVPLVIFGRAPTWELRPPETTPERYKERRFYAHNPSVDLDANDAGEMGEARRGTGPQGQAAPAPRL